MLKSKIVTQVEEFLVRNSLWEQKLVVAVSGGVDSMVLLSSLVMLELSAFLRVVSFDHQIREDSALDFALVEEFCAKNEISFVGEKLNFEGFEKEDGKEFYEKNKKNFNFENEARERRYEFLQRVLRETDSAGILIAQHKDDLVETVLHKFLKGTFIKGFVGIRGVDRKNKVYRPLLKVTKKEIYEEAERAGVPFREDSSNFEDDYDRNFLRLRIVPLLESRYGNFREQLSVKAEFYDELDEFLVEKVEEFVDKYCKKYLKIVDVVREEDLLKLPRFLRFEWLKLVSREDVSVANFMEFEKYLREAEGGKRFLMKTIFFEKNFKYLLSIPQGVGDMLIEREVIDESLKLEMSMKELYKRRIPRFVRPFLIEDTLQGEKLSVNTPLNEESEAYLEKFIFNSGNIR